MVVCGYDQHSLSDQLLVARRLGATYVELYPKWAIAPDAAATARQARDTGLEVWSAHGPWGNESWSNSRVDLASADGATRRNAVSDVRRAIEWLAAAGGRCLVVHPGVLSQAAEFDERRVALIESLHELAAVAADCSVWLCVENMPRGSFPGSFTRDNASIVRELAASHVGLCLDTGHANIMAEVGSETRAAGDLLCTTHVHDNDGQRDSHRLPGLGTVHWPDFTAALDEIAYNGVIMLECPRFMRENMHLLNDDLRSRLADLCRRRRPGNCL
jgi:sugar phosphate isomerase/epimerase